MALGVFWFLQSRGETYMNYVLAAGISMGIGLISEISQIPGPRDAQVKDLVVDAIGILGALGITASFDGRVRSVIKKPVRWLMSAVACVALTIACAPTLWYSYALVQQQRAFPVLLSFEQAWETATFDQTADRRPDVVDAPADWPARGDKVSRSTEDGRWGIFLSLHPVQDWRGYSQLSFVAAANSSRFAMDIGVRELRPADQDKANRYYSNVWVKLEPQRFRITFEEIQSAMKNRPFDFSRVEAVVFSAASPGDKNELLLDDIRLEP